MQRRTFIKSATAVATALVTIPSLGFSFQQHPTEELIGKGNPEVFGEGFSLRKEAYDAYQKMCGAADKKGIKIKAVSSYRTYAHQNRIWERKYKQFTGDGLPPTDAINKIVEYSTIPGTSRHHWATDIDIIDDNATYSGDVLVPEKFHGEGPFCKLKEWLDENANHFGFYIVYTDNPKRKGFKYEPWHYSYAPISKPMLKEYRKLDIKQMLQKEKLMGSDHFTRAFISKYISQNILDINPELLS